MEQMEEIHPSQEGPSLAEVQVLVQVQVLAQELLLAAMLEQQTLCLVSWRLPSEHPIWEVLQQQLCWVRGQ